MGEWQGERKYTSEFRLGAMKSRRQDQSHSLQGPDERDPAAAVKKPAPVE